MLYEACAVLRIVCNNERWRAAVLACHLQPDAMGGDEQEKQLHGISAVVLVLAALRNHLANCAVCAQLVHTVILGRKNDGSPEKGSACQAISVRFALHPPHMLPSPGHVQI